MYRVPKNDFHNIFVKTNKIVKMKNMTYLDHHLKRKDFVPSPVKYNYIYDWRKSPKGAWLKGQRKTFNDDIMEAKHKTPGPGAYKGEIK